MTDKPTFNTHFACLTALFVLGSGVITLPTKNADRYTLYALFISLLFSFGIFLVIFTLQKFFLAKSNRSTASKIFAVLIYISVAVYSLFNFAYTFKIFARFAADILLKDTSYLTAAILLGLVIWFFVSRKQEDVLKFCLVCLIAALPVILFFFLAAIGDFQIRNIFIYTFPDFKTLFKNLLPFLKEVSLPLIILLPFCTANRTRAKSSATGILTGYILLILCISSSLLLFGPLFAARIEYPYTAAVSTVSVGRLFTRMDYFSYFIYFTSSVIRITVCIHTVKECLKRIDGLCKPNSQEGQ